MGPAKMESQQITTDRTYLRRSKQLPARYRGEDTIVKAPTALLVRKQVKDKNPIMPPTTPTPTSTPLVPSPRLSRSNLAQLEKLLESKKNQPAKENQDVIEYDSEAEIDHPYPQMIDFVKSTQLPPSGIIQRNVRWEEVSDGMQIKLVAFLSQHMGLVTVYNELCLTEVQVVRFIKMYNHEWREHTKIVDKVGETQRMGDGLLQQGNDWIPKTERVTKQEASTALDFIDNFGLLLVKFRNPKPPHNNKLVEYVEQCVGYSYDFYTIEDTPVRPGDELGTWVDPEPAQEPMNMTSRASEIRESDMNGNTTLRDSANRSGLREVMNAKGVRGGSKNAEVNDAAQLTRWAERFDRLIQK